MKCRRILVWLLAAVLLGTMAVTAFAAGETTNAQLAYVTDAAGLLTESERGALENKAAEISARYAMGVYIITVDNFRNYAQYDDIYDCLISLYDRYDLGWGDDRAGVSLMLSMDDRDYALDINSDRGDYAFTEAGRDYLEDAVLSYFRSGDYFGGFDEYLNRCEAYLAAAQSGQPVGQGEPSSADRGSEKKGFSILFLLPGIVASALTGSVASASMRSTGVRHDANNYAVAGSLHLQAQSDLFLHRTVSRTPRRTGSSGGSSGSTHHSSGSHSGRSGKF